MGLELFENFFDDQPEDSSSENSEQNSNYLTGMVKAKSFTWWAKKKYHLNDLQLADLLLEERSRLVADYVFEQMCLEIEELEEEEREITYKDGMDDDDLEFFGQFNDIYVVDLPSLKEFIIATVPHFLNPIGNPMAQKDDELSYFAYKFYFMHIDYTSNGSPQFAQIYDLTAEGHPRNMLLKILSGDPELYDKVMDLFLQVWNLDTLKPEGNDGDDDKPDTDTDPLIPEPI